MITLYMYVDGSDLDAVEPMLVERIEAFLASRPWSNNAPFLINQKGDPNDPSLCPDDLPDWDLGLNYELPPAYHSQQGWFADVEVIVTFLNRLSYETEREFVIGYGDSERGFSEDLVFIDKRKPDLITLKTVLGVS